MKKESTSLTPLKRFINLLKLDKKDIYQVFFYAIFSGIVSLSLPLGIQAIINLIQGGRVSLSWIILVLTRWVKLNDLIFDIINRSVKDKFIDILN